MKFCPHCGKEIQPGIKFCGSCGKPVTDSLPVAESTNIPNNPNVKPCPACGKDVGVTASLCPHCGTTLKQSKYKLLLKSPAILAIMLFLGLQVVSTLLLSENGWRLSQLVSMGSFLIPAVYLFYVNKGKKLGKKSLLLGGIFIIGFLGSWATYYINSYEEENSPKIINKALESYWAAYTVQCGKYRYALQKTSEDPDTEMLLVRMNSDSQIELQNKYRFVGFFDSFRISSITAYEIDVTFPRYEISLQDAGYYIYGGAMYKWTEIPSKDISGQMKEVMGETFVYLGTGFQPITQDCEVIKKILKSRGQL